LGIPVQEIRASGGGSRSFLWREIQTDIYGKDLVILRESEGSAYGAALLAGVGAKIYVSVEESAREAIQVRDRMTPKNANVETYNRQYEIYRRLYPAVQKLAHQLGGIGAERPADPADD